MLHGVLSQRPQNLDTLRGGLKLQNPLNSRVYFGLKCSEGRSTKRTSGVIDGTSGSASIADLWAGKFEALLNTKNSERRGFWVRFLLL